jgi:hypothetical protein
MLRNIFKHRIFCPKKGKQLLALVKTKKNYKGDASNVPANLSISIRCSG